MAHVVMAPVVPVTHPLQRYFSRRTGNMNPGQSCIGPHDEAGVFRDAESDQVRVSLNCAHYSESFERISNASVAVYMTAAQLRTFAARLLDAAYDLETYPAAVLMAGVAPVSCSVPTEPEANHAV